MSSQSSNEPSPADNFQLDSGSSSTENLIESLTNTLVLLTQSYKSHLPQTNNQLRTSSNARNKATVQDGRVVVQDVRGRYNANNQGRPFQRNNARGNVVAGNAGGQNRGGNVNPGQAKPIKCYNCNGLGHIARELLDEEQLLFLAGEQVTNFDDDVDDPNEKDLALNVDHIYEADQCDAFDSDVDEAPSIQTMFIVNLSSEDPIYDEAGPSYDSNTPFEVQDHYTFVDHMYEYHEAHEMQNDYMEDNEEHVVQSNVSSIRNDALMSIIDDMHEQGVQKPEPQGEGDDPALELAKKLSLDAHQEKGEGEGADADLERAIKLSLDPSFLPQRQAPVGGVAIQASRTLMIRSVEVEKLLDHFLNSFILQRRDQAPHDSTTGPSSQPQDDTSEKVVHESSSTTNSERTESEIEATAPKVDKEQGEVASTTVTSGVGISVHTENQARSDHGQGHEALAGSNLEPIQDDSGPGKEHATLAGLNPEHIDEDFYATSYPKVHENLKLRTDEHVILENPESSSATLSSMKNLYEIDNFGDQFLNDKPIEDYQEKTNVVTSAPPVNDPVMNISSPTPSSQVNAPPINIEAIAIITTLPEITSFIALQLRVAKLKQDMSEVKKTNQSAAVLASIQSQVPTVVDKYLGTKLDDALLKTLERHTTNLVEKYFVLPALELYHALMEALIEDENAMDKEVADKVKGPQKKGERHDSMCFGSCSRPPSKDSEQSTKNKLDSNTSAAKQPPAHTSSAWQITNTRDTPPGPSMQTSDHQFEQSSDDNPITDEGHVSDPEDTDNAHIPKVPAATWFKPIPEEERPATPEPEWTIPSNDYPAPENN
ncbi:retrovirus-related pol polyprotein from transposon TNT 1-94 [Tanacetum coccineum]